MFEPQVSNEPAEKRLLIVDDDQSVRESVELLMTTLGFDVTSVDNGRSALDLIQNNSHPFDWAIIDVSMDGMDGIETIGHIRNTHPKLPVILATGYSEMTIPDQLVRHPHTALIQKPYRVNTILQILDSLTS